MVVNIGRFGPYVLHDKKFVSIPKTDDPYEISLERSVELIKAKREADANKLIKEFDSHPDIKVLNGRFGPYIKAGKKNVKIPKDKVPAELTLEECIALADAAPEKKGRWGRASAPVAKAEPAVTTVAVGAAPKKAAKKTAQKAVKKSVTTKAVKKVAKKAVAKKTPPRKTKGKKK